jgi:sterol 3beta-glucosyltransferase
MKVLIYAYGTRGDVQPSVALGAALTRAGHEAVLAAPERFAGFTAEHGLGFAPRDEQWLRLMTEDPEVRELYHGEPGKRTEAQKAVFARYKRESLALVPTMLADTWRVAVESRPDVIVHQDTWFSQAHHAAEALGVPSVLAVQYAQSVPSWEYPSMLVPAGKKLPGWLNRLSYVPMSLFTDQKQTLDAWRADTLALPRRKGRFDRLRQPSGARTTVLQGFSRHVVAPAPSWPDTVHTTGFWFLPADAAWTPPRGLTDFLAAGEPPVFVGFGSIVGADPVALGRLVLDAIRAAGVRAVVGTGWGGLSIAEPGDDVFVIDQAPYDWLFPRVRAAVHAGGTGTIHYALAAGLPQATAVFHGEQKMWADNLHRLGAGTEPRWLHKVGVEELTAALRRAVTDEPLTATARRIAAGMRAEDGVAAAVKVLETVGHRALVPA